jgi:AraC family ethanolamine operon transcriptional activator
MVIYIESFASVIQIQGLLPPGMLGFSIPLRTGSKTLHWNAAPCMPGMPASLPGGLDVVCDAGQVHLVVLIELCLLHSILSKVLVVAFKRAASNSCLPATDHALDSFGLWLVALLGMTQREPEVFQHPAALKSVEEDVLQQLLDTVELPRENPINCGFQKRRLGFDRALEFLREADISSLTMSDICSSTNVSQRTLEYAFRENFNMSPVGYLRLMRLHAVRRVLIRAQPGSLTITDTAFKYGIYDMGRFAAVYRQLFGELPSQTLDNPQILSYNPFL